MLEKQSERQERGNELYPYTVNVFISYIIIHVLFLFKFDSF